MAQKVPTPSSLEIHLLGPFRIAVDGVVVEERQWVRRKAQLLVKLLALQPHHQLHREQAMELLWPEADPESATNNLHKTIHAARRALEPDLKPGAESHFILTQGQQVLLRSPGTLWIDVEAFEQAAATALKSSEPDAYEAALALYQGDLLMEDLYEDWAATRREQLRLLHHDLLVRLAQLYETRGQYQQSIECLKELVACDPPNEAAHRGLMRLYALTGNRHQALRQYQQCCEALRKELDAEPDQATVELYEQIASGKIQPLPLGRGRGNGEVISQTISHYRIVEKLGSGGRGIVYKAQDLKLDRFVALKFLPPHLGEDADAKQRFIQEAKAASALDHPNICTIHEISETEDGRIFICMAYYQGETLKKKIEGGPLPVEEAIAIARQMAEGLGQAHEQGIVHRDIKPANVLVTSDGVVKIVDFGLAKMADINITKTGSIMGTAAYMSPEQVQGEAVDHRTDIWSLGVVMYEMVTGQRPFRAEYEQAVIYSILNEVPEPMTGLRTGVPMELERIVAKTMAKSPDDRYRLVSEMLADLSTLRKNYETETKIKPVTKAELPPSIAVLPFADMSPQKDQEYFCDGLAEELINALTKLEGLRVAARTSAFRFRGKELDIREIGKQLNVSTVLEGSVRKAGNRLRITAQLINVADGYHLWSDRYDRQMEDVFAIQDEISLAIVEKLKVRLLGEEKAKLVKRYTVNLEAYDLYLKGRYYFNQLSADGFKKAIEYFKLALEQDPNHALAYAGLAESYAFLGFWGLTSPREALLKAKAAALKALALDNTLADVRHSLGLVCTFNYEWLIAEQEFKRAIELNPNYAFGHICYAVYLRLAGCVDEGLAEIKCAQELDPLSVPVNAGAAYFFYSMRLYDETIEQCQKTLTMEPNFFQAHGYLALAYARKGMYEKSVAEWKTFLTLRGARTVARVMQRAYERAGYKGALIKAAQWMTRSFYLLQVLKYVPLMKRRYISPLIIAMFYAEAGEKDRAFRWLNRAYKEREPQMLTLNVNPHWDSIRSDSRFEELLKKIGLEK